MISSVMALRDEETAKDMAAIWHKCNRLKIDVPDEVQEYFGYIEPEEGKEMAAVDLHGSYAIRKFDDDCLNYVEVDISKLPPGTKFIRVAAS